MAQTSFTTTVKAEDRNNNNNFISYSNMSMENKRKKTTRACLHCQKAHLTCDESRPCERCIKRDLADTCIDSVRKRAKYLQDTPSDSFSSNSPALQPQSSVSLELKPTVMDTTAQNFLYPDQLFDFSLSELGFGSETVGLEYGFIGNMLQNPLDLTSAFTTNKLSPVSTSTTSNMTTPYMPQQMNQQNLYGVNSPSFDPAISSTKQPVKLNNANDSFMMKRPSTSSVNSGSTVMSTGRRKGVGGTPEEVYTNIMKPYNYAEGFHYLIQYVRQKMNKEDLMRISRALALFRPSFLALIMNLTEEDLVFMEKCIQRTLLEYEKLISFSGTPTVIWRRTGEICLVGKEFSLLTQWTKDMLLSKKVYIYELMDNQSAVEYWEKFSKHAFDNTNKSCTYSCIIKTPQQKPVPCTFCFTIKRDIFDLPSVIVGNLTCNKE
ncbi:Putative Transcription activator of gluconeogenesis ERT1 [Rhizopus microsporus]|nr:Putative Transcription activator of gluconeogenesis ERT1 [Rhizopus microsporus]